VALHAEGEEEGREGVGVGSASGEGEVKGGGSVMPPPGEGSGLRRARGVGAPTDSGTLPAEVDDAKQRGAGEEGVRSGGSRLGRCSGSGRRNGKVFLFIQTNFKWK
jgi:hypothetical protein